MTSIAVLELLETLNVTTHDGKRMVSIPNLDRFWLAYDAVQAVIQREDDWIDVERLRTALKKIAHNDEPLACLGGNANNWPCNIARAALQEKK